MYTWLLFPFIDIYFICLSLLVIFNIKKFMDFWNLAPVYLSPQAPQFLFQMAYYCYR